MKAAQGSAASRGGLGSILPHRVFGYAALGYAVLPCLANKWPDSSHVPHGLKDATTDTATITGWLAAHPTCWGLLAPAGVLVLDADTTAAAELIELEYAELQAAPSQRTPRGGAHFWLKWPDGTPPPPTRTGALQDIDIRGLGRAYVLVAPSHTQYGVYCWERPLVTPAALPVAGAALVAVLRPKVTPRQLTPAPAGGGYARAALQRSHDNVAAASVGQRNYTLNCAAFSLGRLVGGGALSREEVEDALLAAAATCGLPHNEAERTIQSGVAAGMLQPRSAPPIANHLQRLAGVSGRETLRDRLTEGLAAELPKSSELTQSTTALNQPRLGQDKGELPKLRSAIRLGGAPCRL